MKPLLFAASLALVPVSSGAADLLQVYSQAESTDSQIKAAAANRDATYEARPQALSVLLPNVSVSGELAYRSDNTPTTAGREDFSTGSLALQAVQPLFRRDRWLKLEQADRQVEQADANYSLAEQDLITRVARAYFGVLRAEDNVAFERSNKKAIARQLDQAQQRFDVGLVAITDVHEAQARFDQSTADEITALNGLDDALEALREIVSEVPDSIDNLKPDIPLTPPEPAMVERWSEMALQNNPSVTSAALNAEIAKQQIKVNESGHYPTLDLVGTLSTFDSEASADPDSDTSSISLQLAVPLYAGGSVTSATRQARALYLAAVETLDTQRRSVDRQVRIAYNGVQSSISRVKALDAARRSAESALEATEAGFEAGTRTLVDVLNGQRDLLSAQRDYSQARYDYILNTLSLFQAAGTLGREDIETVNAWME